MTRHRRFGWLAVVLAGVAAALAVAAACDGWPDLGTHLRDDAYYEFVWACNVVGARGPTVSDGVWTSGVQPLWCLLLGYVCSGQWFAIADFAVVLGVVLHLATATGWVLAGRGGPAAWCAGLLWLGNPLLLRECQNGQETALACAMAALLWFGRRWPERAFTAVAACAALARTELLALVLLAAAVRWRRRSRPGASGMRAWTAPAVAFAIRLGFDLASGGGAWPDAALPMAFLAHANFAATLPTAAEQLAQHWWYLRPMLLGHPFQLAAMAPLAALVFLVVRSRLPAWLRAAPLLAVGLATVLGLGDLWVPLGAALLLLLCPRRTPGPWPRELLAVLAFAVGVVALHWALRWHPRDYYLAPLVVAGGAAVLRLRRHAALLVLVAGAQLGWQLARPLPNEPLRHQRAMAVGGAVIARLLPPGTRVGCFNAGIATFVQHLAGDDAARVVNLDGVVDRRAFAALRRGRLGDFLDANGIRLLLDNPVQWSMDPTLPHACGRWFGDDFAPERDLVELVRCVEPGVDAGRPGTDAFVLAWRRGAGQPPTLPDRARLVGQLPDGAPVVFWPAIDGAVLEAELRDGRRVPLLRAAAGAAYALSPTLGGEATGRLFERGGTHPPDRPILVLAPRRG
ncbi:MAG: hypothetical protein AB7O97_16240 [Planctomycetota bacterium]